MKALIMIATLLVSAVASAQAGNCAILSTSHSPSDAQNYSVYDGESISNLGKALDQNGRGFDNRIERLKVFKGCTLISYQYQDFNVDYNSGRTLNGWALVTSANPYNPKDPQTTYLDATYADKISSVKCFCQ